MQFLVDLVGYTCPTTASIEAVVPTFEWLIFHNACDVRMAKLVPLILACKSQKCPAFSLSYLAYKDLGRNLLSDWLDSSY